jgi:hypothetical protein
MSDLRPPRFPYVGALLCAACVGMAGYLWMRYSYAWDVTRLDLEGDNPHQARWHDRYVRFHLREAPFGWHITSKDPRIIMPAYTGYPSLDVERRPELPSCWPGRAWLCENKVLIVFLDAGRWHEASIAGLVVGAMGVFVFTVAFRHWFGERRKFRGQARA